MRRFPCTVVVVAALVACGGGGAPPDIREVVLDPTVTASPSPDDGPVNGIVRLVLTAQGQGIDIASFVFDEPASLAGTSATFNPATHQAVLAASVQTRDHPDGLRVKATATDVGGHATVLDVEYAVDPSLRVLEVDAGFPSYRSEANLQVATTADGLAVPGDVRYASSEKVAIVEGGSIYKAVTRAGGTDSALTAAELEGDNPSNVPVIRLLVDRNAGDPAIASARATIGVGQAQEDAVTVDLLPATRPPAGKAAYLLPLASDQLPFLSQLAAPTRIEISAEVTDVLGNVARVNGGSFFVAWNPLPPPIAIHEDAEYPLAGDADSVHGYRVTPGEGRPYSALWSDDPTPDDGRRLHHVIVTNPDPLHAVAVGAAVEGLNSWAIVETWSAVRLEETTTSFMCTGSSSICTAPGALGPCDPEGATPVNVDLGDLATASWSCRDPSWRDGPSTTPTSWGSLLTVTGYRDGGASSAAFEWGRFVVPPASGQAPGRLDLYVVRPQIAIADRTREFPLTPDAEGRFRTPVYSSEVLTLKSGASQIGGGTTWTWRWARTTWGRQLTSAVEMVDGILVLDTQAFDGVAGYGPKEQVSASLLPSTISH